MTRERLASESTAQESAQKAEVAGEEPLLAGSAPQTRPTELVEISEAGGTKKCPMCAEEIKAEARICHYCRTRFVVAVRGYCTNCHALVEADEDAGCPQCAGELIDKRVESRLLEERPAQVAQPAQPVQSLQPMSAPLERPGCVAVYAVLLWITAGLIALGGVIMAMVTVTDRSVLGGVSIIAIASVVAVLYALLGRGLWRLKRWARIIVIVLQGLGIGLNLLSVCGTLIVGRSAYGGQAFPSMTVQATAGSLAAAAIGGYIVWWFVSHGELFD